MNLKLSTTAAVKHCLESVSINVRPVRKPGFESYSLKCCSLNNGYSTKSESIKT